MGGDNTCKACVTDCKASCCGIFKEVNENGHYSKKLCTDFCADPGLAAFSILCPCILQGQISKAQGRNCCSSCICALGVPLAFVVPIPPFNYLFLCGSCCYDIPDRKDFNKQNYAEVLVSTACCANVCGRVQLAQQLGIKGWDLEGVKKDTTAAGETFKQDVMLRNL